MSGDGVANLEELANVRRLRVTAVIPPQYNPIRPRLRPPLVEPCRFHSSASTLSPLRPPSRLRPRCSFHLSFLSLFAGAPRPITSGAPHPRRYASALFSFSSFLVLLLSPEPAVALSYSVFYFFPRHPSSYRALASSIFPPFFLFFAISYSAPWE